MILIAGATSYILTALLFLTTKNMPGLYNNGTLWWSFSSLFAAFGYIILLISGAKGRPDIGEAVYNICFIFWGLGLYIGSRKFLMLPSKNRYLLSISFFLILWLIYFYFISYHFLFASLAVSFFIGILNLHLAFLFYKNIQLKNRYINAIIITLSISGIHWLDYPILRPIESFAPIGFSLCAIISVIISALFASLVIMQYKEKMFKMSQEALKAANHDPLTGLGNRNALETQFEILLERSKKKNKRLSLLFLDLDNFKPINDQLGHKAGDMVLVDITKKIKAMVQDGNHIARVGGDEFIIIVDSLSRDDYITIIELCENIIQEVSKPLLIDEHTCQLGVSIGIAYSNNNEETLDNLIFLADTAMYKAKNSGKNKYVFAP